MKLKRHSKLFTIPAILVGLASAAGIFRAISYIIHGQGVNLEVLSVALGFLGGVAVFRYFKMKVIDAWMYYLWLIPQTLSLNIYTFDHLNKTASTDLIYGTYLLPHISFGLLWKLENGSHLVTNFNLLEILGLLALAFILSRIEKDESITEHIAGDDATR